MKTIFFLLLSPSFLFAQSELRYNPDTGYAEVQEVIEVSGQSAHELYEKSMGWIANTYKNPEYVTSGKIEDEMIKGKGAGSDVNVGAMVPDYASMTYEFRIDIKDDKVRYTMHQIRLRSQVGTFGVENYTIKKGEIKQGKLAQRIKTDVESQAHSLITSLRAYLHGGSQAQNEDW